MTLHAGGSGGKNLPSQQNKPYLILISIDGFRWDYQDRYATPAMDRIAADGIRADAMQPVFPTLTFPNHYSIATGLYPANHGLIGNRFFSPDRGRFYSLYDRHTVQDGSWYGGEPVWVAAERNGMVTAAYYFVGTEAPVNDIPLSHWRPFDPSVSGSRRVEQVLDWLNMEDEQRPHLITLYFEDVDSATHQHGPGSSQSIAAIERVDGYLGQLIAGIEALPIAEEVYLVVVSDHGQSGIDRNTEPLILSNVTNLDGLTVVDHGTVAFINFPAPDNQREKSIRNAINRSWNHGQAMLLSEVPADWHVSESAGFAEIIVQADPGFLVFSSAQEARKTSPGDHGWAPEFRDMHGIFLASGPGIPHGVQIPPIEVVDVYPLLMKILGLPVTTSIDGNLSLLPPLLVP